MKKLPKPSFSAKFTYLTCIGSAVHHNLVNRLESATDTVAAASIAFDAAAASQLLHQIPPDDLSAVLATRSDLINVYEERMRPKGSSGNYIYEKILNAPPHRRCPLCSHRDVSTIDHHLDKATFPLLSVAPLNLVPACRDCNFVKHTYHANSAETETIHPYYDETDDDIWLEGTVIEEIAVSVTFRAIHPMSWSATKFHRVQNHFDVFHLKELYESNASNELSNLSFDHSRTYHATGAEGLRASLRESIMSYSRAGQNSWQSAMYRALEHSEWYTDGGAFQ